ncbi:hypothetical protein FO488_00155 [Geobacter sp. FeAm09]|uniref:hypothetical protein n=1 Tax=Geobacter sp. FeAm09 TaxID=2597769 RepID=UPI0011EFB6D8|nr:hypothetical protein [Geobacter sp. FeAm09]QEM66720.1 hypothetical protein FO488_00155 [Geobacter sp. FeAm09]
MAKVTVKVSFEHTDPLYRFLSTYGERFGHGGASVTARLMLDAAFQSAPSLNPFERFPERRPQLPQPGQAAGETMADDRGPAPEEVPDSGRQDLLAAIKQFQTEL